MTEEQIKLLKEDFLRWTGGFEPDSPEEIYCYIDASLAVGVNPEDARAVLMKWLSEQDGSLGSAAHR
jgi:hypothetical protein